LAIRTAAKKSQHSRTKHALPTHQNRRLNHNHNLHNEAHAALTDASIARTPSQPPSHAAAGPTDIDVMFSTCSEAVWETEERPMQQKIIL
jgi:hypothetical protein